MSQVEPGGTKRSQGDKAHQQDLRGISSNHGESRRINGSLGKSIWLKGSVWESGIQGEWRRVKWDLRKPRGAWSVKYYNAKQKRSNKALFCILLFTNLCLLREQKSMSQLSNWDFLLLIYNFSRKNLGGSVSRNFVFKSYATCVIIWLSCKYLNCTMVKDVQFFSSLLNFA